MTAVSRFMLWMEIVLVVCVIAAAVIAFVKL